MLLLNFFPFPVLSTQRLILREIKYSDVNEIFILRSDERVMKYIDRPPATCTADAEKWIQLLADQKELKSAITWAITLKNETNLIGTITLWRIDEPNFRAELGYSLMAEYHRKGLMNEAIKVVIDYGFKSMNLHSIEACINPENAASAAVLAKNAFVKEAHFKENYFFNGKFLDSVIYTLLTPSK